MWQAGKLAQRPNNRIQRIGDANYKSIWRMGFDAFTNSFHHFQIDAQQIITAHPGFTWNACGDDAHIGPCDVRVGIRPFDRGV